MPQMLIENASTGFAVGTTQVVSDAVALKWIGLGWAALSDTVSPLTAAAQEAQKLLNQPAPTNSSSAAVISAKSSTTVLGDSLLAYGLVQQAGSGNSGSFSNSHIGWMNDLLRLNGGTGFDVLFMRAVAGTDVATILANQVPSALTDPTEVAICNAGINSMQTAGPTISAALTSYASIVSQLAAAKKLVIMIGMNPVSQSTAGTQKARVAEIPMVNNAFRKICSAYSNVIFVDSYDTILDPTSNNLEPIANNIHTDGIHKSSIGARIEGYDQLDKIRSRISLTKYKTLGANLLPSWSGTGGTRASNAASTGTILGSGNPPASFDISRILGGNSSSQADVSTLGPDHLRFVVQGKSAGGVIWSISLSAAAQAALAAQFQAGDVVQAGMGFQLSGVNFSRGAYCLLVVDGTALFYAMGPSGNESPVNYPQVAHGGYRMTEPFTFASNPATVDFRIYINNGLSSLSTSTLDVYDAFLAKLT